jgi:hypothetical protein
MKKLPTITRIAPDAGPIPSEPFKALPQYWYAVPAVFWAAILAMVGMTVWQQRYNQLESRDLGACERELQGVADQRNQLLGRAHELAQRESLARRISTWTESAPMLQPAVVAMLTGIEAADMKATHVQLTRHSGDGGQYDLHLTLVGDISSGDQAVAIIRQKLSDVDWGYEEHGTVPNRNTVEYDSLITPRHVASPSP